MKIDVLWVPSELEAASVQETTVIVVDVLRMASTIATAIHNGARAVVPAPSIEEAIRIATSLGRNDVLLCGERQGVRIEGFDLGNSPTEFTPDAVDERTIVLTTTNGTRVFAGLSGALAVYVLSLLNLKAVGDRLRKESPADVLMVCAGRDGRVSLEDALCAGLLVKRCVGNRRKRSSQGKIELGDGARAALALARSRTTVDADFLRDTAGGRFLASIGQEADLSACARRDSSPVVPVLRDRQITRLAEEGLTRTDGRKSAR